MISVNRPYEALVLLKVVGTDAELSQTVTQVEEPIKRLGGQIASSVSWGRRRLAYRVLRQVEGCYHLLQFAMEPRHLDELKRLFKLNETVVRFLVLNRSEAPAVAPAPAAASAPAAVAS